jgi:peptidoglycan/LPS O-acetylase OafA/YrhL
VTTRDNAGRDNGGRDNGGRDNDGRNNFTLLRVSLALMVVLGHAKLLSGTAWPGFPFNLADAAVDSFFVVSGYLITGSYERCRGLLAFYVRRIFRLYPMYLFIVAAQAAIMLALLPGGPLSEPRETLHYLAANAVLANFLQYDIGGVLSGLRNPGINPSLWTLKIEIGFYLIVPLVYLAARRWGWWVLALIFCGSAAYSLVLNHWGDPRMARQLPGQMQFFVTGMALYLYGQRLRMNPWVSLAIAAGFLAAWTYVHSIPDGIRPLIVAGFVHGVALNTPPVRLRTDLSYSVYLLHGPLLQTLILLGVFQDNALWIGGVVCAVLALAFVSERMIERPGTEFGRLLSLRLDRRAPLAPRVV